MMAILIGLFNVKNYLNERGKNMVSISEQIMFVNFKEKEQIKHDEIFKITILKF